MKKKILVVYYSRTGNTRKVAEMITKELNTDIDEITDLSKGGWNTAGKVLFRRTTEIKYQRNPQEYDVVVIGTPILAWAMSPAIRSYLVKNKLNKVAFFCTYDSKFGKTFDEMEKLSEKPLAIVPIKFEMFKKPKLDLNKINEIKQFCEKIK